MDPSYNKISLLVYFVSFFFPVFSNADYTGFQAFLSVPLYINEPLLLLCWSANIVFAIALLAPTGSWKKFFFAFATVSFACALLAYHDMPGSGVLDRTPEPAFFGVGYILWVSAFAITFVGSIRDLKATKMI